MSRRYDTGFADVVGAMASQAQRDDAEEAAVLNNAEQIIRRRWPDARILVTNGWKQDPVVETVEGLINSFERMHDEVPVILDRLEEVKRLVVAQTRAPKDEPPAPKKITRILWNERGNDIDEIVIHDATTVHVEQMDDRCWWIAIYRENGDYWMGNFTADSRCRMRFTEQENNGIAWDWDRSHQNESEAQP